jgi:hypothetical protein
MTTGPIVSIDLPQKEFHALVARFEPEQSRSLEQAFLAAAENVKRTLRFNPPADPDELVRGHAPAPAAKAMVELDSANGVSIIFSEKEFKAFIAKDSAGLSGPFAAASEALKKNVAAGKKSLSGPGFSGAAPIAPYQWAMLAVRS